MGIIKQKIAEIDKPGVYYYNVTRYPSEAYAKHIFLKRTEMNSRLGTNMVKRNCYESEHDIHSLVCTC